MHNEGYVGTNADEDFIPYHTIYNTYVLLYVTHARISSAIFLPFYACTIDVTQLIISSQLLRESPPPTLSILITRISRNLTFVRHFILGGNVTLLHVRTFVHVRM